MADQSVEFIPFHALNEFMRPDYRLAVVRRVLGALPDLPRGLRAPLDRLTRQLVRVPGFRNATQAPAAMRAGPTASAFEKSPELTAAVLAAWAATFPELRAQVWDLLHSRGWELLPPEADRARLPGFLTRWPAGEAFDTLNEAYAAAHPGAEYSTDDVSLMVVWISGQLPVEVEPEDETQAGADAPGAASPTDQAIEPGG